MSLDSIQIFTLCLAVFSTAVNAWVVFRLGTGGFHQHVTLLGHPYPPPPPTPAGKPGLLREVPNDEGPYVDFAPFSKGCRRRCRCHCQV
ncbi:hypothetical protein, partial [Xylella fastidiosa]|uniref:hypothetical protein n=1 Tax=Xylella fastidiosa TaxID=2371 RepID=UPI001F1FD9B1